MVTLTVRTMYVFPNKTDSRPYEVRHGKLLGPFDKFFILFVLLNRLTLLSRYPFNP